MSDILAAFLKIKDDWLEWKSIPSFAICLVAIYVLIVGVPGILSGVIVCLYLAFVFLSLLGIYILACAIHVNREKATLAVEETGNVKASSKETLYKIGISLFLVLVVVFSVLLATNITNKDGKYVIWADGYRVAMTHKVHKDYYLSGADISVHENKLENYPRNCIFYLDFKNDGTFTIAHNDKLLGVTPGKNGVGFSSSCTSVLWTLEEAGEDVYYILNVEEETYLKWFDNLNNWTTNHQITDENREEYVLCLEKVN